MEGKRHLGAVIGSKEYKDAYCNEKVSKWGEELHLLSQIAGTQPHAAYTAFTKGYRSRFTYFLRTIPAFEDYLDPIDEILNSELIPTLFGQEQPFPREFRDFFTLTPNLGGLGIISPKSESPQQYSNSVLLTKCEPPQQYSNSVLLTKSESPQQYSNSVLLTKSEPPQQYSNSVLLTKCEPPQQYSNSVLLTKCEPPQQYSNSVLLTKSESPQQYSNSVLLTKCESPQQYSNSVLLTKCEPPQQYSNSVLLTKCEPPQQYSNSVLLIKSHVLAIKHQCTEFTNDETKAENAKKQIRLGKGELLKAKVQRIDAELEAKTKRMVDQARDTGASSWLNTIPLEEQGLCLDKEEFRDAGTTCH